MQLPPDIWPEPLPVDDEDGGGVGRAMAEVAGESC